MSDDIKLKYEKLEHPAMGHKEPKVKTLEDPLIEVIELESKPPVQDSAKEIFSLFFINNLTIFLESFFMS